MKFRKTIHPPEQDLIVQAGSNRLGHAVRISGCWEKVEPKGASPTRSVPEIALNLVGEMIEYELEASNSLHHKIFDQVMDDRAVDLRLDDRRILG